MRFLKIGLLKNKQYNRENYSLFQFQMPHYNESILLGNIIRRTLLKESMRNNNLINFIISLDKILFL